MSKHTKGPWTLETVKTSIGSCHVIGTFKCCIYDDYRQPGMETEKLANARLIAAAPELLEALKFSLEEWVQYDGANDPKGSCEQARMKAMRLAKAAIAKAEGNTT